MLGNQPGPPEGWGLCRRDVDKPQIVLSISWWDLQVLLYRLSPHPCPTTGDPLTVFQGQLCSTERSRKEGHNEAWEETEEIGRHMKEWRNQKQYNISLLASSLQYSFLPRFLTNCAGAIAVAYRRRDPVLEEVVNISGSAGMGRQQASECCKSSWNMLPLSQHCC